MKHRWLQSWAASKLRLASEIRLGNSQLIPNLRQLRRVSTMFEQVRCNYSSSCCTDNLQLFLLHYHHYIHKGNLKLRRLGLSKDNHTTTPVILHLYRHYRNLTNKQRFVRLSKVELIEHNLSTWLTVPHLLPRMHSHKYNRCPKSAQHRHLFRCPSSKTMGKTHWDQAQKQQLEDFFIFLSF